MTLRHRFGNSIDDYKSNKKINNSNNTTDEHLAVIFRLYEIIKQYELLTEFLLDNPTEKLRDKNKLLDLLQDNSWNVGRTANKIGISRVTLYKWMKKHNLSNSRINNDTSKNT